MADETIAPVLPGWVMLTAGGGEPMLVAVDAIDSVIRASGVTEVDVGGTWTVTESPAEVAALIAEAQRAQRRAEALPVMAAKLYGIGGMGTQEAVAAALAIIDAIEAREAGR